MRLFVALSVASLAFLLSAGPSVAKPTEIEDTYAVVVSKETQAKPDWAAVVETLTKKHHAQVVVVPDKLEECADQLKQIQPRYVCFVARPEEVSTDTVRALNKISRAMDDDPYVDYLWGIITGYTADDAMRIAKTTEPLIVRTSLSTTGVNLGLVDQGLIISDGAKGTWSGRIHGVSTNGTCDGLTSSKIFREYWNDNDVDLLVTSSHATQVNLEMPFSLGAVVCASNHLYTLDQTNFMRWVGYVSRGSARGGEYWFAQPSCEKYRQEWSGGTKAPMLRTSTKPKVYLAAGNCLIADTLTSRDSMVVTWLSAGGVSQFVGYTVGTWYGKGGWGTLDMWTTPAGHVTLSEAVFLNNQRILWQLKEANPRLLDVSFKSENMQSAKNRDVFEEVSKAPKDKQRDQLGMMYDRDVLVLYGDPAWEATFDTAKQQDRVNWTWKNETDGCTTLTLHARKAFSSDAFPIMLPHRMRNATVVSAGGLSPVLNDEFILFPDLKMEAGKDYVVKIGAAKPKA
jgi:zinc protease